MLKPLEDEETLAEIERLEDKLAKDVRTIGRVDSQDRMWYEELCRKHNWGEKAENETDRE